MGRQDAMEQGLAEAIVDFVEGTVWSTPWAIHWRLAGGESKAQIVEQLVGAGCSREDADGGPYVQQGEFRDFFLTR